MISIYLFGPPRLERDGAPIHISRRKGLALVSYLAQTNKPASRETLATLFWPEHDHTEALKSLRRELARLKKELDRESITATQSQLAINADATLDVFRFQKQLQVVQEHDHFPELYCMACLDALTSAVNLYSDDFMAGFNLLDCSEFDAWQDFQRESLRQSLGQALHQLTIWNASLRDYDRAINYGRRWLALDPLHEAARRALMQVCADAGRPAVALRVYEEGAQLLQEELGISPAEESRRLWQEIRAGRVPDIGKGTIPPAKPARQVAPVQSMRRRSNLPRQPTPFVGRSSELMMIQLRLQEPACRLFNLVGPGGIGKTRLALEVGRCILDEGVPLFADGIFFVPLTVDSAPEGIVSAIVEAAAFTLYGNAPPEQKLLDYLFDKQMLFILDNLEHLLEGGDTITAILAAAPGVKILATSRAALRLQEEWFHPLGGLSVPPPGSPTRRYKAAGDATTSLRAYDAVRLFEQCAHHASPTFSPAEDVEHVVRICRLVEGMPLALELAAAWLKVLDVRAVADELEQSLDLLDSRFRNMPERHQSIRAVFDQTWAMLNPAEQEVLARLSVFRGGFTREAAVQVAGATLFLLSGLIEKALLHKTTHGRYRLHELLRQFAAEQLEAMYKVEQSHAAHSRYYLLMLGELESDLKGANSMTALKQIRADLENIRQAWNWALGNDDIYTLGRALESIYLYFFMRGRNREGIEFLEPACTILELRREQEQIAVLGCIVSRLCLMKSYLLPISLNIEEDIQTSLAVAQQCQDHSEIAFCHFTRANFHTIVKGDMTAALSYYEQAQQAYIALNESFYLAQILIWKGFCYGNRSCLDLFFKFTREGLALSQAVGNKASVGHALGKLTIGAFWVGDYDAAEANALEVGAIGVELDLLSTITHSKTQLSLANFLKGKIELAGQLAKEAYQLALDIHYPASIAYTLTYLGLHASLTGDYLAGKQFAEESLQTPSSHFGAILGQWVAAIAHCGLNQDDEAWRHALTMLLLTHNAGFVGMTTWPLPVMAILRARAGQEECAVELLALAQTHPLSPNGWQNKWPLLAELRRRLKAELGAETFAAAWERGLALDLDNLVATILDSQDVLPCKSDTLGL